MQAAIVKAVDVLKNAGLVALPTDTVYGLAVDPQNKMAVRKLYLLKGRDAEKPLVYMIKDCSWLTELVIGITPEIESILKKYWPGALTVIFRKKYTAGTIGIRIPDSQLMLDLLAAFEKPLAVTSANVSGQPELNSIAEIEKQFGQKIDLYLNDNNIELSGQPSTVIDVSSGKIKVLRKGAIEL